jgi:hypothetical protein
MSDIKLGAIWQVIAQNLLTPSSARMQPKPNMGILSFLVSPANTERARVQLGGVQVVEQGNGKAYRVIRRIFPRLSFDDAPVTGDYCMTEGKTFSPKVDEVYIDRIHASPNIEIDNGIIRCIREGRSDYEQFINSELLRDHLERFGRKVATEIAKEKRGNFYRCDCNAPKVTIKDLPLFQSNGLALNPMGQAILDQDMTEAQMTDPFVLIGGQILRNYQMLAKVQGLQDIGIDGSLFQQGQSAIFYDSHFSKQIGNDNAVLAIGLGALQLITYAKNKGDFAYEDDTHVRTTFVDPYFGLEHDIILFTEKCGEEIKRFMRVETRYAIVGVPDCWTEDCHFEGVTDVFTYNVVCADTGACDIDASCGAPLNYQEKSNLCDKTDVCEKDCKALFDVDCGEFNFHKAELDDEEVNSITVNGLPIALDTTYDVAVEAEFNALVADLQAKLGGIPGVLSITGDFASKVINIVTTTAITSAVFGLAGGGTFDFDTETNNWYRVTDRSTASVNEAGDCTISDLSWTASTGTLNGAPNATIPFPAPAIGTYGHFFLTKEADGELQLVITDTCGCTDLYSEVLPACGEVV